MTPLCRPPSDCSQAERERQNWHHLPTRAVARPRPTALGCCSPRPRKPTPLGRVVPPPLSTHPPFPPFPSIPSAHPSGRHLASVPSFGRQLAPLWSHWLLSVTVRVGSPRSLALVSPRLVSYPPSSSLEHPRQVLASAPLYAVTATCISTHETGNTRVHLLRAPCPPILPAKPRMPLRPPHPNRSRPPSPLTPPPLAHPHPSTSAPPTASTA